MKMDFIFIVHAFSTTTTVVVFVIGGNQSNILKREGETNYKQIELYNKLHIN